MSKIIILKSKHVLAKDDSEKIAREIEEKTGITTIIIDPKFDIEVIEGDK